MTFDVTKLLVFVFFVCCVTCSEINQIPNGKYSHKYSSHAVPVDISKSYPLDPSRKIEISFLQYEKGISSTPGDEEVKERVDFSDGNKYTTSDILMNNELKYSEKELLEKYQSTLIPKRIKRNPGEFDNLSHGRHGVLENDDFNDLVRNGVGEQQNIRHGRSRNHFSRMGREKKNNALNTLHYNDQFLNGSPFGEVLGGELPEDPLDINGPKNENSNFSHTNPNGFKALPSDLSTQKSTGVNNNENKYDLRSFFGITAEPKRTEKFTELPTTIETILPTLNYDDLSNQNVKSVDDKKSVFLPENLKFSDVTTFFTTKITTQTSINGEYGKGKNGNNVPSSGANGEKQQPKSSLESVHSFINYKNRSKKKDDAKSEAETETSKSINIEEEIDNIVYPDEEPVGEITEDGTIKIQGHADIVTRFLRIVESQHLLGENCTAGTDLNLGEGVVDRYAQERFRVEADVAVNRANMLTRLWKYAGPEVMYSEYLLHASVFSMVEFDDDIFAAGNCYDQYQYKDYQLFCPFAYRLPEGPILVKDLAVEYKYLSNTSEWFYIARKNAENVIRNYNQFSRGFNTYTYNESAHTERQADEILSVTYEDGKWSKPYYDCGGGNIWMLTYTVPFFGYANDTYFFKNVKGTKYLWCHCDQMWHPSRVHLALKAHVRHTTHDPFWCEKSFFLESSCGPPRMRPLLGTSGIDIDLRRVDIDQCPLQAGSTQLNIFAATDKCKKRTTDCVPLPGLGFRRGSYKCVCKRGFYFPEVTADHRFYNGTVIEEEYEKLMMGEMNRYSSPGIFECLPCAEGCEACVDNSPCVVSLNWLMRTAILVLDCVVICCLPFVVFFTWKYGNVKVVRAASPVLLRVIALGALFIYCTNIVMYPRPTVYTCTARVWLREIGFCLTYGALMLKTWRISVIFRVRSAKAVKITDFNLLKRLGIIVAVFSVFLVIRTLVAPPIVIVGRTATDLKAYLCKTDWWDHSFTTLEVIFLIWGIRLCIVVRKAPSEFNESRFISMAIYNEFLLSVFLNISMFFLQSPANPDLLYIIFFCHTQLTITLLLCLIFGSKAYMVFKGHGKGDHEGSSMVAKPPAGKFINKSRSGANSQYATSTNSSAGHGEYARVTEQDIQEEFRRLYAQLEILKDKNLRFGNRHLTAKISAMQEAAARQDSLGKTLKEEVEPNDDKKKKSENSRFNNVFSAMADKLTCSQAITPGEESTSSGREYITEICESTVHPVKSKRLNVTFSPLKNGGSNDNIISSSENDNTKKYVDDSSSSSKSPKSRQKDKSVSSPGKNSKHDDSSKGCDKCLSNVSSIDTDNGQVEKNLDKSTEHSDSDSSALPKSGTPPEGESSSPNHTPGKSNKNQIKSGHARTHAIVINLDDKSRFTEEVTV